MKKINPFEIIYVAISLATMQHTIWSSSFVFEGEYPKTLIEQLHWIVLGLLIAITIDLGMFLSARYLRNKFKISMFISFVIAALASFYMQLIYAAYHTGNFTFGEGVAQPIVALLQPFIEYRTIILPMILPLFAVVYTMSNRETKNDVSIQLVEKRNENDKRSVASRMDRINHKNVDKSIPFIRGNTMQNNVRQLDTGEQRVKRKYTRRNR